MNDEIICPACKAGSRIIGKKYPGKGVEKLLDIESVAECPACGLAFAWPIPDQDKLDNYYSEGAYWNHQANPGRATHLHSLSQAIARANVCKKWLEVMPDDILDVGAGFGWQADGMIQVFGHHPASNYWFIEPDDNAANQILNRVAGLQPSRISSIESKSNINLIFANQVLEHVADPVKFLNIIASSMAVGGHIYIEVPNRDDLSKDDVFPHTLFYSPESLREQLESTGLDIIVLEEFGKMLSRDTMTLFYRLGFRVATYLHLNKIAIAFDKLIWKYQAVQNGIWLRVLAKKIRTT